MSAARDARAWAALVSAARDAAANPSPRPLALKAAANEAHDRTVMPVEARGDRALLVALRRLALAFAAAAQERRTRLAPGLSALAAEGQEAISPERPLSTAATAWTRRADCGVE